MKPTRSQRFWNWFREHEHQYRSFFRCSKKEADHLMHEFQVHLKGYCRRLYGIFEAEEGNNTIKLIITANCRALYFASAERLVTDAPGLKYWKITALQAPCEAGFTLAEDFADVPINIRRLWFEAEPGEKEGRPIINVYSQDYSYETDHRRFYKAVQRVLCNLLGERSYALDIGEVRCDSLAAAPRKRRLRRIEELPGFIARSSTGQMVVGPGGELRGIG